MLWNQVFIYLTKSINTLTNTDVPQITSVFCFWGLNMISLQKLYHVSLLPEAVSGVLLQTLQLDVWYSVKQQLNNFPAD